ncbi:MAG TPA: radical SAM protein [Nitrospirae bacterium]|nr:pyrroloquinoline quinone biosynthesis protein PqqE [bacterium BMS3Abin06]HDH11394.1 radical SAM protein [Nitrospirota bacterium]HDZ01452.1 radical SAM protein [Nitrospirota bacterium]
MDKYLIDSHKLLWHLDRVTEWQDKRVIAPVYIEISPVSFCNHKCIFCGIDFARDKGFKLEREALCKRLEEMGKAGVKSVMFAGEGEPLLHKDLPEFIRTASNAGIDVSVTTNGTLGNYDLWKETLPHLTWIRFSVDAGTAGVHARVHNVPETFFERTVESIEQAVKVKKVQGLDVTVGVQFLIIEENLNDIENALSLFSGLGVDYISLKPYSLHPQMIKKKETVYTDEVIRHIDDVVDGYRKNSGLNIIFRKEALKKYMTKIKMFKHCSALPFWGYISSKGDFYTCSVFIGDERFKTGNIHENNIDQIFFGQKRKQSIRYGEDGLVIKEECRLNCRMARINEFLEIIENKPEHANFI